MAGLLEQKTLVVCEVEHVVYGLALEEGSLELQSSRAVIEQCAVRQDEADSASVNGVMRRFPDERRGDLFVGNGVQMIGISTPLCRWCTIHRCAAPRWITND